MYQQWGKRLFDTVFSAAALILLLPVFFVCAIAVKVSSPGPILFRHRRVGRFGREFQLLKFRTMRAGIRGASITVAGDPRITRVGRVFRRYKLDELPQLINIVRGDMSVVGPRPEVPEFVSLYTPQQREILNFRPGLTGAASVAFFDEESLLAQQQSPAEYYLKIHMHRKIDLDSAHARNQSFSADLAIIAATVRRTVIDSRPRPGA